MQFNDPFCFAVPACRAKGKTLKDFLSRRNPLAFMPRHSGRFKALVERRLRLEHAWMNARRPYYNVYPSVCEAFQRTKLDLPSRYLEFPPAVPTLEHTEDGDCVQVLAVRFAKGHELPGNIEAVFFARLDNPEYRPAFVITGSGHGHEDQMINVAISLDDESVESRISEFLKNMDKEGAEVARYLARIAVSLCLLRPDSELVEPDVLSKDRLAYEANPQQEIVDRAHRRGKIGWNVGRTATFDPRIVGPYFAIRWMGRGKNVEKKPVIRPISGYETKRDKIREVPTGYLDDDIDPAPCPC